MWKKEKVRKRRWEWQRKEERKERRKEQKNTYGQNSCLICWEYLAQAVICKQEFLNFIVHNDVFLQISKTLLGITGDIYKASAMICSIYLVCSIQKSNSLWSRTLNWRPHDCSSISLRWYFACHNCICLKLLHWKLHILNINLFKFCLFPWKMITLSSSSCALEHWI